MENPWSIHSIYDLQYFNCPSCVYKNHSKQQFINHAYEFHPDCVYYLENVDDNSLRDVSCPWNGSDVKTEPNSYEDSKNAYDPIEPHVKIGMVSHSISKLTIFWSQSKLLSQNLIFLTKKSFNGL